MTLVGYTVSASSLQTTAGKCLITYNKSMFRFTKAFTHTRAAHNKFDSLQFIIINTLEVTFEVSFSS